MAKSFKVVSPFRLRGEHVEEGRVLAASDFDDPKHIKVLLSMQPARIEEDDPVETATPKRGRKAKDAEPNPTPVVMPGAE